MRAYSILFMLILCLFDSHAAGIIKGVVKDYNTKEELIGATVSLANLEGKGTVTGLDGSFILSGLKKDAVYVIECAYMGYEPKKVEISTAAAGKSILILLNQASVELASIEVKAAISRNNEVGARMLEKMSPTVLNVVSANAIESSPDLNVSNILQRVSGVTIDKGSSGDGEYAVLRGMDKRYNYTLVNGVKIPSPDNKNRYVPLNIFPGELLDRLEVSKSLSADMEGDATGGVVNMVMKDAPSKRTFNLNISTGYTSNLINEEISIFDHKNITKESPRDLYGSDYSAKADDFSKATSKITNKRALPDIIAGVMFGDRFFNEKFGVIAAGSYQRRTKRTESVMFKDVMPQTETNVRLTEINDRVYSDENTQYGAHLKFDYLFNDKHKIDWCNSIIGSNATQVREGIATNLSLNYDPETGNALQSIETRSRTTKQQILTSTLHGEHIIIKPLSVDWSAVASYATNDRPDMTYINLENNQQNFESHITADNSERRWEKNTDRDYAGYLNLKYDIKFRDSELNLKAGAMYRDKERTNKFSTYRFTPNSTTRPIYGIEFTELEEIDWKVSNPKGSVGPLNYEASEKIAAGYLMGTYDNRSWNIIAGLRVEHTDQRYLMEYPNAGDSPDGKQVYYDLLPSVALKYKAGEKMNLRASYFRSINRPGFFEIVPYSIINEDYTEYGNKDLKRAVIDNVDLRWEFFPNNNEQLMVGVFYKKIQDPIEYAYYTKNNRQFGYGPANLGDATNTGVEVDFIKYFRCFGIKANYTYTHSSITTPKTLYSKDENGTLSRNEVNQTRPLVNQAPHVANLTLIYKNTKYNFDAQIAGVYTGEKIIIASHYLDSDYWEAANFNVDFSAEKRFKSGISIFIKANNLIPNNIRRYIKGTNPYNEFFPLQNTYSNKTLIREDKSYTSMMLGFRYKM